MNRKLRSTLPITREARRPIIPNHDSLVEKKEELRKKQKENLIEDTELKSFQCYLQERKCDRQEKGTLEEEVGPRSYIIGTPSGSYRRNKRSIVPLPSPQRDPPNSPRPTPPTERSIPPPPPICRST